MISLKIFVLCLFSTVLILSHCSASDSEELRFKILGSRGFSPGMWSEVQEVLRKAILDRYHPDTDGPPPIVSNSVGILESMDFTDEMMFKAAEVLTDAVKTNANNPCESLRDSFLKKYPEYDWQCVGYNAYAVTRRKSVTLEAGNKKYLLFSTR